MSIVFLCEGEIFMSDIYWLFNAKLQEVDWKDIPRSEEKKMSSVKTEKGWVEKEWINFWDSAQVIINYEGLADITSAQKVIWMLADITSRKAEQQKGTNEIDHVKK